MDLRVYSSSLESHLSDLHRLLWFVFSEVIMSVNCTQKAPHLGRETDRSQRCSVTISDRARYKVPVGLQRE